MKVPLILLKSNCSQTLRKITQSQSFVCLNGGLQVRGRERERRGSSQRALGPPYPGWRGFNCLCLYAGFGLRDWPIKESEKFEQNGVNFTFAPTINHGPSVASRPGIWSWQKYSDWIIKTITMFRQHPKRISAAHRKHAVFVSFLSTECNKQTILCWFIRIKEEKHSQTFKVTRRPKTDRFNLMQLMRTTHRTFALAALV